MERVAKLIHHITTLCEPDRLGRTKIAKILWLADVEYYRKTGQTITQEDAYVKDAYGPRHSLFYPAIESLKHGEKIVERPELTPVGTRREYVPLVLPDMDEFSADEIAVIDRVAGAISKLSAKDASELTHDELWDAAYLNERIPVAAATPVAGELTPEINTWAEAVFDADRAAG